MPFAFPGSSSICYGTLAFCFLCFAGSSAYSVPISCRHYAYCVPCKVQHKYVHESRQIRNCLRISRVNCQLLYGSRINCSCTCMLSWTSVDVIAMNNLTKWRIAASISMGLPENCQLVWVLSLRTISGRYNTHWFVLLFCVWIVVIASAVVVLSWQRKGRRRSQKIDDFSDCRSGTLAMLSSKVNGPVAHGSTW